MINHIELMKHSFKAMYYSVLIAIEMKLPLQLVLKIAIASLFHDVGKFCLDDNVLYKVGKLTDNEFNYIKKHAELGSELLRQFHFPNSICNMVLQHHENDDGTGYPNGLNGSEISLGAKIIRVADVYSSLTADRVYRKHLSEKEVVNIILEEVSYYDNEVLRKFLAIKRKKLKDFYDKKELADKIY